MEHTLIEFSLKSADSAEREQGKEDENEREKNPWETTRGVTPNIGNTAKSVKQVIVFHDMLKQIINQ